MNNLLSYCGLTDSRMSASDTDLLVIRIEMVLRQDNRKLQFQEAFQPGYVQPKNILKWILC